VRRGEAMGLGSVWLSERFANKNVEVLSGAAAAASTRMGIASGLIANLPLRHPVVTAGYASTMMSLSGGRFALGLSRGQDALADASGTPRLSLDYLRDYIGILRRLWQGEAVSYDGPVGRLNKMSLGGAPDTTPPVIMAVMGEKSAYWAGRNCDGVLFYSWWNCTAIERLSALVRKGAVDAGRDPFRIRIWSIVITACELTQDEMLVYVMGRLNAIQQSPRMFDAVCAANGWNKGIAERARAAMRERGIDRKDWFNDQGLSQRDFDEFRWTRDLYPDNWFEEGAAIGSADDCAQRICQRFAAGADGILLHGGSPGRLAPLLKVWPDHRPALRFDGRIGNPGL
jgi:probable F420-dependent oxidoreductase